MKQGYRKYLERAARQTILIHRADTLIRLILRTVVSCLKLEHAGMFIYDKIHQEYIVKISRGRLGYKVPSGFAKITKDNPLIRYFLDKDLPFPKTHLLYKRIVDLLRSPRLKRNKKIKPFLEELKFNLSLYDAKACIPGFFREELIALLFLGSKRNKRDFSEEELSFLAVLASDVVMSLKNAWLIEDLNNQIKINKRLFFQTVLALASSIEAKDRYTRGHTERVVRYALGIAESLKDRIDRREDWQRFKENLYIASLLHDIGKIGIPERILNKRSHLSLRERAIIHNHPLIGASILSNIEEFKEVVLGVKYHHERYDGKGYPFGLKKNQIPLIAAIISLADAFDAMTTERPYRKALTVGEALRELRRQEKKQFLPRVVRAFLKGFSSQPHRFSSLPFSNHLLK